MARGSKQNSQAASLGLLFGQRRPKHPNPSLEKTRDRLRQQQQHQQLRQQYFDRFQAAEEDLLGGDGQPMLDLLSQDVPLPLTNAHYRVLADMSSRLQNHFRASNPQPLDPNQPIDLSPLAALQALRQQAASCGLAAVGQRHLRLAMLACADRFSNQELYSRLAQEAEAIGPLPRIWVSESGSGLHLRQPRPDGRFLCGLDYQPSSSPWHHLAGHGRATPLDALLTCDGCRDLWRSGTSCQSYSPGQWLKEWAEHPGPQTYNLQSQATQAFSWDGPAADMAPQMIVDALLRQRLIALDNASFGARLELPPALRHSRYRQRSPVAGAV